MNKVSSQALKENIYIYIYVPCDIRAVVPPESSNSSPNEAMVRK